MGAATTILAAASLAVTVVGTVMQQEAASKARSQQERAAQAAAEARAREEQLQTRRADIIAARERRRAAAEAARFRAASVNLAANRGAGGSIAAPGSLVPGISGNIQSQLGFNNAFIGRVNTLNAQIRGEQMNIANIQGTPISANAGFGQALSAFGGLGLKVAGSPDLRKALGF